MVAKWMEALTGSLEQKKQYRRSMARIDALPAPYRDVAKALHRYILASGGVVDGDSLITMFDDFADLWEQAAADRTPVREIVGDDPSEFADAFVQAYAARSWVDKERKRLADAVAVAVEHEGPGADRP